MKRIQKVELDLTIQNHAFQDEECNDRTYEQRERLILIDSVCDRIEDHLCRQMSLDRCKSEDLV